MKMIKILSLAVAMASVFTLSTQAISITGTVDMSGTATLDNAALGSATKATGFVGVTVGGIPDGSFTGVAAGTPVSWSPFGWNPQSLPAGALWTFTSGLWTYSFTLEDVTVDSQSNTFLNLLGTGTLAITGVGSPYDPTAGTWSFTISNSSGNPHSNFAFTFANSQTAAVPDGGATAILLGVGLLGLGALRRKA
jgi:hypothetical protein